MPPVRSAALCWGQHHHVLRYLGTPPESRHEAHITTSFPLPDGCTAAHARAALTHLVRRHEVLRTVYDLTATPVPRQLVLPPGPPPVVEVSAGDDPAAEVARLTRTPFAPDREGPMRACLITAGGRLRRLHLVFNHLAFDDVALDLLAAELTTLLAARVAGRPAELPPVADQPVDLATYEATASPAPALTHWRRLITELPDDIHTARRPSADAARSARSAWRRVSDELPDGGDEFRRPSAETDAAHGAGGRVVGELPDGGNAARRPSVEAAAAGAAAEGTAAPAAPAAHGAWRRVGDELPDDGHEFRRPSAEADAAHGAGGRVGGELSDGGDVARRSPVEVDAARSAWRRVRDELPDGGNAARRPSAEAARSAWLRVGDELPDGGHASRRPPAEASAGAGAGEAPAHSASFTVPGLLADARVVAERHRVWPSAVHVAAHAVALAAHSGGRRVAVRLYTSQRPASGFPDVLTCMSHPLLCPLDLTDDPTFGEVVRSAADRVREAMDHAHVPFALIDEAVAAESAARGRSVRVANELNFLDNAPRSCRTRRERWVWNAPPLDWARAGSDLYLRVYEWSDGVTLALQALDSVLDRAGVERTLRGHAALLAAHRDPATDLRISDAVRLFDPAKADPPAPSTPRPCPSPNSGRAR
ncbi:condensation domain-containing protein [Streptomyces sp. NBRC 109706]|uniref:condensation domain-containing protein n=1 Tax=Streptomyces sp. NBRC 109706 TaxID=1550035 RepID=UPI00078082B8|nr:condensation domain-containing protein [Streptomyces sp. NBRC 109706]